jgi:hypothetical protein
MRRSLRVMVAVVLLAGIAGLALTLWRSQPAGGAVAQPRADASPPSWSKVVQLGGSLSGAQRGRSFVTVDLSGNAVRFDVTYGPAPGWGAKHARLRYWLYPVGNFSTPPAAIPLNAKVVAHQGQLGSKTVRLETAELLSPGTYQLLYLGSGWYSMTVYQRAQ